MWALWGSIWEVCKWMVPYPNMVNYPWLAHHPWRMYLGRTFCNLYFLACWVSVTRFRFLFLCPFSVKHLLIPFVCWYIILSSTITKVIHPNVLSLLCQTHINSLCLLVHCPVKYNNQIFTSMSLLRRASSLVMCFNLPVPRWLLTDCST